MDIKILDSQGVWLINTSTYAAFIDPTNGARFEPGVVTKATHTDWVKGQPVLARCDETGAILPPAAPEAAPVAPTPSAPAPSAPAPAPAPAAAAAKA